VREAKGRHPIAAYRVGRGAVATDPAGQPVVIPFPSGPGGTGGTGSPPAEIGNVITNAAIGDNRIVRGDGGVEHVQGSIPGVHDDGRITELTNGVDPQDAATVAQVAANSGHLHGIMRTVGDGASTTFDLVDIAEYLMLVAVNGLIADPATHALSSDGSQIVFDTAPTVDHVIVITYVIALP